MAEIFDEYGNYIFPTDVSLDKPNVAIGDFSSIGFAMLTDFVDNGFFGTDVGFVDSGRFGTLIENKGV